MNPTVGQPGNTRRRLLAGVAVGTVALAAVVGCSSATGSTAAVAASTSTAAVSAADDTSSGTGVFDSSTVQSISVDVDPTAYQTMIDTYVASGEKDWISATVTINGTVFTDVGIKLKGNSSLMGLRGQGGPAGGGTGGSLSADAPEGLPWRIRLDKFVDGQNYQGETDMVVRANNSQTSLNEAVALELIGTAGMPTEDAAATSFSVNGSEKQLRLLVQTPDDDWYSDTVGATGILYKAEAGGDYSYRGDDSAAYADAFEVEANTSTQSTDEYPPLIAFLKWLNESDDATFAAELDQWVDVDSFADYLAIQDLVANSDDIDGPGNNSYLSYDEATGLFTVISWDQNLSFGGMGGMGGGQVPGGVQRPSGTDTTQQPAAPDGAVPPTGGQAPTGAQGQAGTQSQAGRGGPGGAGAKGGNVLSEKFMANQQFAALVAQAKTDLKAELYDSGTAQQILDTWSATLTAQATDLVSAETITAEADKIAAYFTK